MTKILKLTKKINQEFLLTLLRLSKEQSLFNKSRFTLCDYRENDKCPPWTIQASEMLHDNKKKTIFYEHAVVKSTIYQFFICLNFHILIRQ